jgi:hypothetical protein
VDTRLDEDKAELAVLVLAVGLEVLADGNSLLDQHVEVLGDVRAKAFAICQPELTRCLFDIALQILLRVELRRLALSGVDEGIRTVGLEDAEDPRRGVVSKVSIWCLRLGWTRTCYRSRPWSARYHGCP